MNTGYTKLFSSIVASTIWNEPSETRIVWITLLALADKDGCVAASIPGLAILSRVDVDKCRQAITHLESPDPDSRTPDYEGRRIEKVDGGWKILNHQKYREKLSEESRREYKKVKEAERRAKLKEERGHDVDKRGQTWTNVTQAEAEAEADTKEYKKEGGSPDGSLPSLSTNGESAKGLVVRKKPSPIPARLAFLEVWKSAYRTITGREYVYSPGKDGKAIDGILINMNGIEALRVAGMAWKSSDPFIRKCSASIASFYSQWNTIIISVECDEKPMSNRGKI